MKYLYVAGAALVVGAAGWWWLTRKKPTPTETVRGEWQPRPQRVPVTVFKKPGGA